MRGLLACLLLLCLTGCGGLRVAATVRGDTEYGSVPAQQSWVAVPLLPDADADTVAGVDAVAEPLAKALAPYGWKRLPLSQFDQADVLVLVLWRTEDPVQYYDKQAARDLEAYHRRSVYRRDHAYRIPPLPERMPSPAIQTLYTRQLLVEALRADALDPAARQALRGTPQQGPVSGNLAQAPYAPPLDTEAKLKTDGTFPESAFLWRVVVTSSSRKDNLREVLPLLAQAAAQGVGKNTQLDLVVDSEQGILHTRF